MALTGLSYILDQRSDRPVTDTAGAWHHFTPPRAVLCSKPFSFIHKGATHPALFHPIWRDLLELRGTFQLDSEIKLFSECTFFCKLNEDSFVFSRWAKLWGTIQPILQANFFIIHSSIDFGGSIFYFSFEQIEILYFEICYYIKQSGSATCSCVG